MAFNIRSQAGWHRLWAVCSLGWLVFMTYVIYDKFSRVIANAPGSLLEAAFLVLLPPLCLLGAGHLVAWVIRGFTGR